MLEVAELHSPGHEEDKVGQEHGGQETEELPLVLNMFAGGGEPWRPGEQRVLVVVVTVVVVVVGGVAAPFFQQVSGEGAWLLDTMRASGQEPAGKAGKKERPSLWDLTWDGIFKHY